MRYAIYFTPPPAHPLTRLASNWIGRDAFTGKPSAPPRIVSLEPRDIALKTAAARRYGFHATLKAPFALAPGQSEAELRKAADAFAMTMQPFVLPALQVTMLDSFLALVPAAPCESLDRLAAETVIAFDRFRAPLSEPEIARRRPDQLTIRQFNNLQTWGYPHVFEEFRFHMTLTGPVERNEAVTLAGELRDYLAPALAEPVTVDGIAVFAEEAVDAPFRVLSTHHFDAGAERRSA